VSSLSELIAPDVDQFLVHGEDPLYAFMGADYEVSAMNGGSSRIVLVTHRNVVTLRGGLLRRSQPKKLEGRRPLSDLHHPAAVWPGRTLIGEEFGEAMDGIWVHRRYRPIVEQAYAHARRVIGDEPDID